MFNLGPMEMLVIVVVALVVLGPQRLPEAMRQVGRGVGEIRRWTTQVTSEVQSAFAPGADPAPLHSSSPVAAAGPLPPAGIAADARAPVSVTGSAAS